MKKKILIGAGAVVIAAGIAFGAMQGKNSNSVKLDPNDPQMLTVWHYYNGMQQQVFDDLVKEFNESVGAEKGIFIEAQSKGSVNELSDAVYASANHEVGAEELPDIFASYADTAYDIDNMGLLTDLDEYLTAEEKEEYVDAYIQEGYIGGKELKLFPIAKSTEIFLLNETTWDKFAKETGADKNQLKTWEGLVDISRKYYEWTDAKTPDIKDDGQAFYGRDAFANYMLIGSKQLGKEIFHVEDGKMTLQLDRDIMKRLWDCYYVPYVNGWFGAYGRFRSDDIKTGQIISLVGSTSGALYFPSEVTDNSGKTQAIECGAYTLPNFEGTDPYAVQQGAGMVVTKSSKEKEYAATVFLKWITDVDNNISFSLNSGYLPVKKEANNKTKLEEAMAQDKEDGLLKKVITVGSETVSDYSLYTPETFKNGNEARRVVENNMQDAATAALEKRDKMMAEGTSKEKAVESLTNDQAFEAWFNDFTTALNDVTEK